MPSYKGCYVKEFDLDLYNKYDGPAKEAIVALYERMDVEIVELIVPVTERSRLYPVGANNYKGDLFIPEWDLIVEVEMASERAQWQTGRYSSSRSRNVFERKAKYAEDGQNVIMWSLSHDLSNGWYCMSSALKEDSKKPTGQRPGEYFYVIDKNECFDIDLRTLELQRAH